MFIKEKKVSPKANGTLVLLTLSLLLGSNANMTCLYLRRSALHENVLDWLFCRLAEVRRTWLGDTCATQYTPYPLSGAAIVFSKMSCCIMGN